MLCHSPLSILYIALYYTYAMNRSTPLWTLSAYILPHVSLMSATCSAVSPSLFCSDMPLQFVTKEGIIDCKKENIMDCTLKRISPGYFSNVFMKSPRW